MTATPPRSLPLTHSPSEYAETLPLRYRALYLRATSDHRPSARKAMCLECLGWSEGAVKSIRLCPSRACPNHAVRPYQDDAEREKRRRERREGPVTSRAADPESLKRAREARRQRGEKGGTAVMTAWAVFCGLCLSLLLWIAVSKPNPHSREDRCPPVSTPTGRLLCYSGGILVYQTETYRNGGVLCSPEGVQIDTIPGDSVAFCVEESTQGSVWDPPIGAER